MVLVHARQPFILAPVTQALREQGVVPQVVVPQDPDVDLIDLAWEARPSHIIAVSSLPALANPPRTDGDDALLAEALSACQTPARPMLVWVTAAGEDDEALRRIRRSGVPYAIIRTGRLVKPSDLRPTPVASEEVLVPTDLSVPEDGLTSLATIADAVADAVRDDDLVGRTIDVASRGDRAWVSVVESYGGSARMVSRGRARWSRFWGGRVLCLARDWSTDGVSRSAPAHVERRVTA